MESVLRGAAVYIVLLLVLRIAGRRTLSELTTFDFVLLLVIGEATQQAMLAHDPSITNAVVVILTLVGIDVVLTVLKQRSRAVDRWLEGTPMVVLKDGEPLADRMRRARIDVDDILHAARERQGLERLDQIRYAVLERNGGISVIPRHDGDAGA